MNFNDAAKGYRMRLLLPKFEGNKHLRGRRLLEVIAILTITRSNT